MKYKLFAIIALIAFNGIFSTAISRTSQSRLSALVKDNYAVVKTFPENPYRIRVNIYLDNMDATERTGKINLRVLHQDASLTYDKTKDVRLEAGKRNVFSFDMILPSYDEYTLHYTYTEPDGNQLENTFAWLTDAVNFFYAFTTPHRMATSLPDSSDLTLFDVRNGSLSMSWSYDNLNYYPYDSFREVSSTWQIDITPELNGKPFERSTWTRLSGYLPILKNVYESDEVVLTLEGSGAATATIVKVTVVNKTNRPQHVRLPCIRPGNYTGYNFGWVDDTQATDNLLAGWKAPADQVIILGIGADAYPLDPEQTCQMNMDWNVAPGQTRTGWLIRPHYGFHRELDALRQTDWEKQFDDARKAWEDLLAPVCKIIVPDRKVTDAFYAGVSDFFVMREPIGPVGKDYIVITVGTEAYRSGPFACEAAGVTVALSQIGLTEEAEKGFRIHWDLQDENGDWTEFGTWTHLMWTSTGFKAWAAMEYYFNTLDRSFLEERFPQMLAA